MEIMDENKNKKFAWIAAAVALVIIAAIAGVLVAQHCQQEEAVTLGEVQNTFALGEFAFAEEEQPENLYFKKVLTDDDRLVLAVRSAETGETIYLPIGDVVIYTSSVENEPRCQEVLLNNGYTQYQIFVPEYLQGAEETPIQPRGGAEEN